MSLYLPSKDLKIRIQYLASRRCVRTCAQTCKKNVDTLHSQFSPQFPMCVFLKITSEKHTESWRFCQICKNEQNLISSSFDRVQGNNAPKWVLQESTYQRCFVRELGLRVPRVVCPELQNHCQDQDQNTRKGARGKQHIVAVVRYHEVLPGSTPKRIPKQKIQCKTKRPNRFPIFWETRWVQS